MKSNMINADKINWTIARYKIPRSIRWKFVDQNEFHINKKYGLMTRKIGKLKVINEHVNLLTKAIEK